jgi:hypothetical protein
MDRSGLGGAKAATSAATSASKAGLSGGLKAPSGPKDDITKLVRELEALVKTKRAQPGAVAGMDSSALRAYISQIDRVVTVLDTKSKLVEKLMKELYHDRAFESAVRDRLVTHDQAVYLEAGSSGLKQELEYARSALRAKEAQASKAHQSAMRGPVSAGVPSAPIHKTGPPSGLLWIGGGGEKDADRKKHGDFIAGNQPGATIDGDWKTDEFWKRVEASGAKYFAIDEGSDSWLYSTKLNQTPVYADYEAAFAKLVGAVYGATARNGGTSTLLFSVPDEIRDDNLWVPALIQALVNRKVHSDNVWLTPCKGGGSNSIIVNVTIGTGEVSSTGGNSLTYEWIQTRIKRSRGNKIMDEDGNPTGFYERAVYDSRTYYDIVRYIVSSSSSSHASSPKVLPRLAAYTSGDAHVYAASAVAEGRPAPPMNLPVSPKKERVFKGNDSVKFKLNGCRLGGKVISYNYSDDTYLIERIHGKENSPRLGVNRTDVIGQLPLAHYWNHSTSRDFTKASKVWYHEGYDEYPGTVIQRRDYSDKMFDYLITYIDEDGNQRQKEALRSAVSSRE